MSKAFINYRRSDAAVHANLLYDWIRERYGEMRVFKDVDTIEPGLDFEEAIERAVASSEVMLVVIGKDWVVDANGRRRLDDVDDYVRMEIATALRSNIRVIPVLVEEAQMPASTDLPEPLMSLPRRQAFELSDARSRIDRTELLRRLDIILGAPDEAQAAKPPPSAQEPVSFVQAAPVQAPPVHVEQPAQAKKRTASLVRWGWILVAGTMLIPFLALVSMVLGALTISRGDGKRTWMGIAIIASSILMGLFASSYWIEVASA